MPHSYDHLKLASAMLLVAAMGPATAQGIQGAKSKAASAANIPTDTPPVVTISPAPCPGISSPVLQSRNYLVVNRTSMTLVCRMRTPTIGGWSDLVSLPPGARLIDKRLDLDEIQVQCKAPVRPGAVRVFPGARYSLLRERGKAEIALLKIVPGR